MTVQVQVLFDKPQREIKSLLQARLDRCHAASLVSGFVTVEGIEAIAPPIRAHPTKLSRIVVGAGTYRAYEAFDGLIASGIPLNRFFVHLGHSRATGANARHRFYRYHPMLHSKIYMLDMEDGSACAFIGSHNVTGFALLGLNGEAGVLIEGTSAAPEFVAIRNHIDESVAQSVPYAPGMKEAYSWWTTQYIEGFRDKIDDRPREGEARRTIVIIAVRAEDPLPKKDDVIYFEIPAALGGIQSLRAEVHIYIFNNRPPSPRDALRTLDQARTSLWCQTKGLEVEQGGVELRADWYIDSKTSPELKRAPRPFRPRPSPGMQQVRVKVWNRVFERFEYLFQTYRETWEPIFDQKTMMQAPVEYRALLTSLGLKQPEDREWFRVIDLSPGKPSGTEGYRKALLELSPEAGGFHFDVHAPT